MKKDINDILLSISISKYEDIISNSKISVNIINFIDSMNSKHLVLYNTRAFDYEIVQEQRIVKSKDHSLKDKTTIIDVMYIYDINIQNMDKLDLSIITSRGESWDNKFLEIKITKDGIERMNKKPFNIILPTKVIFKYVSNIMLDNDLRKIMGYPNLISIIDTKKFDKAYNIVHELAVAIRENNKNKAERLALSMNMDDTIEIHNLQEARMRIMSINNIWLSTDTCRKVLQLNIYDVFDINKCEWLGIRPTIIYEKFESIMGLLSEEVYCRDSIIKNAGLKVSDYDIQAVYEDVHKNTDDLIEEYKDKIYSYIERTVKYIKMALNKDLGFSFIYAESLANIISEEFRYKKLCTKSTPLSEVVFEYYVHEYEKYIELAAIDEFELDLKDLIVAKHGVGEIISLIETLRYIVSKIHEDALSELKQLSNKNDNTKTNRMQSISSGTEDLYNKIDTLYKDINTYINDSLVDKIRQLLNYNMII